MSEPRESAATPRYRVPAGTSEGELAVKNSVFIGSAGHARDAEAAAAFVARVRAAYPDANHHAWAYRISGGPQGEIGSSDDGEPGGTAGRPMLAVLEGSGLHEVVVVGTRFFGGIKLGTGGLVRAYSAAAREALSRLPTRERVLHRVASIEVDYALYGQLRHLLPQHGARVLREEFGARVGVTLAAPVAADGRGSPADAVAALLRELTSGEVLLAERWERLTYLDAEEP